MWKTARPEWELVRVLPNRSREPAGGGGRGAGEWREALSPGQAQQSPDSQVILSSCFTWGQKSSLQLDGGDYSEQAPWVFLFERLPFACCFCPLSLTSRACEQILGSNNKVHAHTYTNTHTHGLWSHVSFVFILSSVGLTPNPNSILGCCVFIKLQLIIKYFPLSSL